MATLPLGDIDLYWERRGEGPRLLFVNGSASTIESSAPLIDASSVPFKPLAWIAGGLAVIAALILIGLMIAARRTNRRAHR